MREYAYGFKDSSLYFSITRIPEPLITRTLMSLLVFSPVGQLLIAAVLHTLNKKDLVGSLPG
jgi:hypothetical protein